MISYPKYNGGLPTEPSFPHHSHLNKNETLYIMAEIGNLIVFLNVSLDFIESKITVNYYLVIIIEKHILFNFFSEQFGSWGNL